MSGVTPVVPTAGQNIPPPTDIVNGSLRVMMPGRAERTYR